MARTGPKSDKALQVYQGVPFSGSSAASYDFNITTRCVKSDEGPSLH